MNIKVNNKRLLLILSVHEGCYSHSIINIPGITIQKHVRYSHASSATMQGEISIALYRKN